jgi:hypothetical protein
MEDYKAECVEIMRRFKERQIDHRQCVASLDAAIAGVLPGLTADGVAEAQRAMAENYRIIAREVEWRKITGQRTVN